MLERKVAGQRKKTALLGAVETAGGGGSDMLLLGLNGGCWWIAGCLVRVWKCLNWAVEVYGGSWLMGRFLDRKWSNCLWWMVGMVVGCWAEAWVLWGGGVQVSSWVEFGLVDTPF